MYSCHSILECYNPFSGVKLNMRSFSFIIIIIADEKYQTSAQ